MLSFVPLISDVVYGKKGGVSKGRNDIKNFLLCMEIVCVILFFIFFLRKTLVSFQLIKLISVCALYCIFRYHAQHISHLYASQKLVKLPSSHQTTHMHTRSCTLLFIVHSFMWRASSLAWYCIILQPTLSFPAIPWGTCRPQAHNSDCVHWIHSNQRKTESHFSFLASRADNELCFSNWILVLVYIIIQ